MLTITTYETVLRKRVLHLAAQRPLSTVAHEIPMSRNTLERLAHGAGESVAMPVRTLRKIETWCVQQEAAREYGGYKGEHEG